MYASTRALSAPHLSLSVSLSLTDDKFAKEELGLNANVCQTHATAIAANNCSHKKYFDNVNKKLSRTTTASTGLSCVGSVARLQWWASI